MKETITPGSVVVFLQTLAALLQAIEPDIRHSGSATRQAYERLLRGALDSPVIDEPDKDSIRSLKRLFEQALDSQQHRPPGRPPN